MPRAFHLFCLYIVLLTLLPTGSVYGVNVKVFVFLPLIILGVNSSLKQKGGLRELPINIAILMAFFAWALLSQFYPVFTFNSALIQYKDVATTLIGCWLVRIFTLDDLDREAFAKLCIYTVAFGGFIKVAMFSYSLYANVSIEEFTEAIYRIFGIRLMTIDLNGTGIRIEFISDILIPICLFAILCMRKRLKIRPVNSLAIVSLLLFSSIFTFSRFLWANTVVGIVLGMFVARKDKMHILYIGGAVGATLCFFDQISTLIALRFSDKFVDSSDIERVIQKVALQRFFIEAAVFGHGLGSYSTRSIRSIELPYSYELQILALFGQVGVVGILLFTFLLFNYYRKAFSFRRGRRSYQISLVLLLICFLASGFFNPNILSSTAAVNFGLIFCLASLGSCRTETLDEVRSYLPGNMGLDHISHLAGTKIA
jgi:hypothetical protein